MKLFLAGFAWLIGVALMGASAADLSSPIAASEALFASLGVKVRAGLPDLLPAE